MQHAPRSPSQPHQSFTPDALILDMDGLMIDSEPLWFEVERAFCEARGGAWTHEHARLCTGRGVPATLEEMNRVHGFPIDVEADTRAIIDAFVARVAELRLKPGCIELIDVASPRLPLAVASSSPLRLIHAALARFDLLSRFGAVISGESVARPKPAPDIFLHASDALRVSPPRCAAFEDSLAGATAARAAGMFVIAVPEGAWEGRGFEAVSDVVVGDLFEARDRLSLPSP